MRTGSVDNVSLSTNTKVKQYRAMESKPDLKGIADFVEERFSERYLRPLQHEDAHGFAIMANCCLLIETVECFRQGWPETPRGKGSDVFRAFLIGRATRGASSLSRGRGQISISMSGAAYCTKAKRREVGS